jgi:hypothetical protein
MTDIHLAEVSKNKAEPKRKVAVKTIHQKELQQIRDVCGLLKQLTSSQQTELQFRRKQDYEELKV